MRFSKSNRRENNFELQVYVRVDKHDMKTDGSVCTSDKILENFRKFKEISIIKIKFDLDSEGKVIFSLKIYNLVNF